MQSFIVLSFVLVCTWTVLQIIFNRDDFKNYKFVCMSAFELLLGYADSGKNIVVDMRKTPHLLITGLSGQGKSKCLNVILRNLDNADIVLANAFNDDFIGVNVLKKIYFENDLLEFIDSLLISRIKRDRPFYLVLEELGTLKNKVLLQKIQELLLIGRHYNIFIIGVIQIATKEELKFKSYFNARCSFKQLDSASYRVVLSVNPEEELLQREFYLLSDGLYKGNTFNV